ncbi:OPT oligopeptide transporter protein-domain-containing protein [Amylocarpus encephaloides]|uniref:OPT oligopeptide transporter protein-domain-containing protein n=1 Tax=Amylocarpus encephaloides TaxID=45428 RepID=A0A9P8C881_9HELO|nr:OPT oligopeptide transporter protein-domain-containing protein [Amylocarpus encephaloides]
MAFSSFRRRLFNHEKTPNPASEVISDGLIAVEVGTQKGDDVNVITQSPSPTSDPEKASDNGPSRSATDGEPFGDDDPVLRDIPWHVRRVISLHDDPTEPTLTFRYFVLTLLFVIPGAFLSQMSSFRTTYAPYSVFFVQIASNYVGIWLAKVLPSTTIRLPGTSRGLNLNPGPWSTKEHVLVTISAASGATYNLAYAPISMAELYFDITINPAIAILFMWSVVYTGYSFAALARQFLLYDPHYPWFQALCQTTLFETQKKQRETPSRVSRKQMKVFFGVLIGITLWQFLPEYIFPMLGSLAFLCWVAPRNPVANFVGSGFGGMGFLNLSLDWSNLSNLSNSNSLFVTPWWTQVIIFLAFVVNCWILLPAAKWGNLGSWKPHLMSNRVFTVDGDPYPIKKLITPDISFNETAYEEYGPLYVGTQQLWNMFFDYASYTSAISWACFFGFRNIRGTLRKLNARRNNSVDGETINHQYDDQLNILMRSYKEVPWWWSLLLFLVTFVIIMTILATGNLFIPWWTYFVALATGAVIVIPLGWLYALSNFQLPIGTFNELIYGIMVNAVPGHKNPCGATIYSSIAGDAWYRAQLMLQDQKIGHYMHIPPRAVFFSQVFGCFIGVPINYGVIRWVLTTRSDYISGKVSDPTHQWTGQSLATSLTTSVQYVLVGPTRLFTLPLYSPLPYGFLLGALAPPLLFTLHTLLLPRFPNSKLHLFNTTIFFSALSNFYGNISTGYTSSIIGGFVVMFWAYRYRYELWARYCYILAAAFDAGFNLNMLCIFLFFGAGKVVKMREWWGNRERQADRCFALE